MIVSIRLINFQGYQDSTIKLDPKFNCIVGIGNSGKSTIIRALNLLWYGAWEESWVTFGKDYCELIATLSSGVILHRKKGPKINEYSVTYLDGKTEKFENFGVGIPEEIAKATNIFAVELPGGDQVQLNLHTQFGESLLQSVTSVNKGRLFGKLSGLDILDTVSQEVASDRKQCQVTIGAKQAEVLLVGQQLQAFTDLPELRVAIDKLTQDLELVKQQTLRLEELKDLRRHIVLWKTWQTNLGPKIKCSQSLETDQLQALDASMDKLAGYTELQSCMQKWKVLWRQIQDRLKSVNQQLRIAQHQYDEALRESHVCPTCQTPVSPEHLHTIIGQV